ncbi:MAG: IMP dehydrogenase [Candidatus Levybacteria bacterium]|nr:IMP dehydrogenase [Candidatus Levybacteria bacterium]MDZ4228374.1 IMP dehydrogenase [Candidatus Levybacteria bacterium]
METVKIFPHFGLTFDDVLLIPSYSDFTRKDTDISTKLTKKINLSIPFVSAPMDTVTESSLALELGRLGGIGIIHRNLTIEDQIKEVRKVKVKKIIVGAAIAGKNYEERVRALVEANVDVVVIDSAHGFTKTIISAIKFIKKKYPKLEVIAGNIATAEGARALIAAGVDGLRVGMGPGAICTTRIISGMGMPQITAIMETAKIARKAKVPVIADGGIKYSGDMVKALAAGASTVMMGGYFAASLESPGKVYKLSADKVPQRFRDVLNQKKEFYSFKEYRGMGSIGAMEKGAKIKSEEEFHGKDYGDRVLVAEGVEGLVPIKGTVKELVDQAVGGIRSGMCYVGARNIKDLWEKSKFIQITQASLTESHPHDVLITNPGENYK